MIKKAVHIIMAAAVLISTMGITINMHFCHDQLIDLALNSVAESCCDASMEVACDHQEGISQTDHCEDDSIVVEVLEDFLGSSLAINFNSNKSTDLLFRIALHFGSPGIHEDVKSIVPETYLPPSYQEVDLSQIQSFLI
jgi:hypothetical protein